MGLFACATSKVMLVVTVISGLKCFSSSLCQWQSSDKALQKQWTEDNSQPQFDSGDSRPEGVEDAYLQGASSERKGLGKIFCGVEKEVKNG